MDNKQLIEKFYHAFEAGDAEGMIDCYAEDVEFTDPAFGYLKGEDAKNMWRMLLKTPDVRISLNWAKADGQNGSANWIADYKFSRTCRMGHNDVIARFHFSNGKIVKHTDTFNMWKWSGQALGLPGYLLGWSQLIQKKVRKQALSALNKFKASHH